MKPQTPAAPSSGLINDVTAPVQPAPTETQLAEPPKEATFIEAPASTPAPPATNTPVAELAKELPEMEAKSTAPVIKDMPTKMPKPTGSGKPTFAIALSVTLFVALAAVAYYAYTKTA
jgi:hypothetical protein